MGRKLNAPKYQVWNAQDTTSPLTSVATVTHQLDLVVYELEYSSTVNAVLTVQYSNDSENIPASQQTWSDVEFGQTLSLVGASDTKTNVVFSEMPYKMLRLKLANNGGTGTISAYVSGQTRGA